MAKNGQTAVVHYTGTLNDGTVFDTSRNIEPLEFVVGSGRVIHGFDMAVLAMEPGERKAITIAPEDAYGLYDDTRIELSPMYAIPGAKDLKVGRLFYFCTEEGLDVPAKILSIDKGIATVDFNHPLAGKTLNFDIELLELR
jgi:FKBP-type peptidyl-prolyl cis-trans isomerase 2